jgi:uncharacterized protein
MILPPDEIELYKDINDNVHGFIKLTKLEWEVVNSPFFQRLRNIKQLGLMEYVFPGAVHNRFNHSLGVLHIADKMVVSIQSKKTLEKGKKFLDGKRSVIRMAALLHDIGHYPLSHVTEGVVKEDAKLKIKSTDSKTIDISIDDNGLPEKEDLSNHEIHKLNFDLHQGRNLSGDFAHHERITSLVILKTPIYDILKKEFSHSDIIDIVQIIAGTYPGPAKFIIHSELDADRFDYLLRDSKQTGVSYGLFDFEQIIRSLEMYEPEDNRIVVDEKSRSAVEHYLMCRYFLYSAAVYHKTTVSFEIIIKKIYEGLMERNIVYSYFDLINFFRDENQNIKFLEFNDLFLLNILKDVSSGKIKWDVNKEYNIKDPLLNDLIDKVLTRKPLKLVTEDQQLIMRNDSNTDFYLFEPGVIDSIVSKSGIEDYWYITYNTEIPVTSIGPYISLSDDPPSQDKQLETIKILKHKGETKEVKNLIEDKSSVIRLLSDSKLQIHRIYTKDKSYKEKISQAIQNYEKKRKK